MSNTRKDKLEIVGVGAVKNLQDYLKNSGVTEVEAIIVLRVVTSRLEQAISAYIENKDDSSTR